jgi:hypothetical protein
MKAMKLKSASIKVILFACIWMGLAFNARSEYVVNGSASSTGNDCFILTPNNYGQAGMVWYENFLSLNYDFDMTFQVYLGNSDGGADGIAFVMQPNSTGSGSSGGGLGYQGISPSIAVEYDTWQNDDPWYDHISIQRNGDVNFSGAVAGPIQASASSSDIEDGQWHSTRITWDASTNTLTAYFDGVLRLTYSSDIVTNTFAGNPLVYWGFTGATGAATNLQQFCVISLSFEEVPPTEVPLSPWALAITIFFILVFTLFRYRKSI